MTLSLWMSCTRSLVSTTAIVFFFFQAEDGIRDHCVTGVQTCGLPISFPASVFASSLFQPRDRQNGKRGRDRKSTRLNSSHTVISYAVFCLKKKNKTSNEKNSDGTAPHTIQTT